MDAVVNSNVRAQAAPANPAQVTDAMVKHMVQQFLRWKLPEDFNPDGGIQFVKRTDYGHTFEPVGTNLFDYRQAKAMVRHMLEGLPAAIGDPVAWHALCTKSGGQMVHTIKSSLVEDADRLYGKNQWTLTPLTAAIGAGEQAVAKADQVFDAVLSCPHSIDAQSVVLKAAYDKPGNALKQLHDRITAALSQPHPADERVVDVLDGEIEEIASLITPSNWSHQREVGDFYGWCERIQARIRALSAKEGR